MRIEVAKLNTSQEVEDFLREALSIIEKVVPPEDLRGAAFTLAVQLLSNKTAVPVQDVSLAAMAVPRNRH